MKRILGAAICALYMGVLAVPQSRADVPPQLSWGEIKAKYRDGGSGDSGGDNGGIDPPPPPPPPPGGGGGGNTAISGPHSGLISSGWNTFKLRLVQWLIAARVLR